MAIQGTDLFLIGRGTETYTYSALLLGEYFATKDYVDTFMPKTGGNFTGIIRTNSLIKSTRPTNFAFQIKPNDGVDRAHWSTTGRIEIQMEDRLHSAIRLIGGIKIKSSAATNWDTEDADAFVSTEEFTRVFTDITHPRDVATKGYVDDQDRATRGFRWELADHQVAENLVQGEFFVADNGNLYLHSVSYDSVNIGISTSYTSEIPYDNIITIHNDSTNLRSKVVMRTSDITYNVGTNNYIRVTRNTALLQENLTIGNTYHLNLPGVTL